MWEPEEMYVGELYANALKTFSVALIYSPLWPLAHIIVLIGLLITYLCFNFAIIFWWRPPPDLSDELLERFRHWLVLILLLRYLVELVVDSYARPNADVQHYGRLRIYPEAWARFCVQLALIAIYLIIPWGWASTKFGRYRFDADAPNASPYNEQKEHLAKYDCPAVGPKRPASDLQRTHEQRRARGLDLRPTTPPPTPEVSEATHGGGVRSGALRVGGRRDVRSVFRRRRGGGGAAAGGGGGGGDAGSG